MAAKPPATDMDDETRLITDLARRINERLVQWANDSIDLFDMAGLDEKTAEYAVFLALVRGVKEVATRSDIDIQRIQKMLEEANAHRRDSAAAKAE